MTLYIYDVPALATFRVYAQSESEAIEALLNHALDTEIEFVLSEQDPRVEFVNVTTNPTKAEYISEISEEELEDLRNWGKS